MEMLSGRSARHVALGLCVTFFLAACGGGTTANVGGGGSGGGGTPPPPPPPAQTNSSLTALTVNQSFAAVSGVLSADISNVGVSSNVTSSLSGADGQAHVDYAAGGASFALSINQGGVTYSQTFASSDVDQAATTDSVRVYRVTRSDNTIDEFALLIPGDAIQDLSYVTYGQWNSPNGSSRDLNFGVVVFGVQTPAADIPTSGSAVYDGITFGTLNIGSDLYNVGGYVELTANFSTNSITGFTSLMSKQSLQSSGVSGWRDLNFDATITSGTSLFSGSAASADSAVTGTFTGGFFGPVSSGSPPEIGGGWRVSGSGETAVGGFVGKR